MRTLVSAVATVLAVLLAAVAVPAIWLDRTIVQEDGFVQLAAPWARTPSSSNDLRRRRWAPSIPAACPE
ncbi:hypothetical protein [Arthrobacter ulcerisalmonis]|uniref:hypothetical protein n=1 Tax=Arthrobacter ulcerisalmonis TaxID=2483813 RepID=UPI00363F26B3